MPIDPQRLTPLALMTLGPVFTGPAPTTTSTAANTTLEPLLLNLCQRLELLEWHVEDMLELLKAK